MHPPIQRMTAPQLPGWWQPLRGLFNPAGGLPYHITAWRHQRSLWGPYRQAVARVLDAWSPPERQLVVIGPSAGWNLPAGFLQRFDEVVAVEPDPLARWLLRRRFGQVRWSMDTDDYFAPYRQGEGELCAAWQANTARLLERYPHAALLWSEFLGQLLTLYPSEVAADGPQGAAPQPQFEAWKAALCDRLRDRSFCSFHDRWVARSPPLGRPLGPVDLDGACPAGLWPGGAVVVDAMTAGIVPANGHQRLLLWQRLPDRWHAMAAVWAVARPVGVL